MTEDGSIAPCWNASSFAFHDYHFVLDDASLRELLRMTNEIGTSADYRIADAAYKRSSLSLTIARLRSQYLDGYPGFITFAGFDRLPEAQWKPVFRTLSLCFGSLCPQDGKGLEIKDVRDRGTAIGEGKSSRYSDSRTGGSLHTDGAESPPPGPDYFALLCVVRAKKGGAMQMIDVNSVIQRLSSAAPSALQTLRQPFHFDRRGELSPSGEKTVSKPVIFKLGGFDCATYLREYINAGHAHHDIPDLTAEQIASLDALDEVICTPSLQVEGYLNSSEAIIVNNRRILHGRTAFEDDTCSGRKRLLLRTWIRSYPNDNPADGGT